VLGRTLEALGKTLRRCLPQFEKQILTDRSLGISTWRLSRGLDRFQDMASLCYTLRRPTVRVFNIRSEDVGLYA